MTDVLQPASYQGRALPRIAWTPASADLHVNLVALEPGATIETHANAALDVVMTCLDGAGTLIVDEESFPFVPGTVAIVPMGSQRGVVAGDDGLRYTTCHRKRGGIMPKSARPKES